ncbi:hypothetical protein BTVI_104113 [Pitangus sulphuratus]|nr:hypothetical protein BTVI_104113 [Pitangus sulphuratus]
MIKVTPVPGDYCKEDEGLSGGGGSEAVFNSETSCLPGTWSQEFEDRDKEQTEDPILGGKSLLHLEYHKSAELDGVLSRVLKETVEKLTKQLLTIYQQSCSTREVAIDTGS